MVGLADGEYQWNGEVVVKKGGKLTIKGGETIAGSCVLPVVPIPSPFLPNKNSCATLLECLVNFINWTGAPILLPQRLSHSGNHGGTVQIAEDRGSEGRSEQTRTWWFSVRARVRMGSSC